MGPNRRASDLLTAEIRRVVASAIERGGIVYARASAATILQKYPDCGFDERELADKVMMAAAEARVPVLFGGDSSPLAA